MINVVLLHRRTLQLPYKCTQFSSFIGKNNINVIIRGPSTRILSVHIKHKPKRHLKVPRPGYLATKL